ncbi:hypothetical protein DXG01_016898 [Tephrocybe rancida]|nr:hypothetical protein DXG01_016898 [Tephrocybe rancida]
MIATSGLPELVFKLMGVACALLRKARRMHFTIIISSLFLFVTSSTGLITPEQLVSPLIPQKILFTFHKFSAHPLRYPQYTDKNGTWQYFSPNSWSSGFFPATLYALEERLNLCPPTPDNALGISDWLARGRSATANLVPPEPEGSPDHDRAFLVSFLEELTVNPSNVTAQTVVTDFANILANRFNPAVGCTRSWDDSDPYKVIIDNMMSLEYLILAARITENSTFYDMAVSHADTTTKNHIRDDGSTWHIVEYDSKTGVVVRKRTAQGFSDDSTWTRGQAWAIYGFTTTPRPADSSAATISAMGLLLLAHYELDETNADRYTNSAIQLTHYEIMNAITSLAWAAPWESLLSNATVSKPAGNSLTGIMYGDYYYVKVGNELISRGLVECP